MHSKIMVSLILINLLLVTLIPLSLNAEEIFWWDDNWSYRIEIIIPFDTSESHAKFQPIDTMVEFNNPCWVKNEQEHSIRVILQIQDRFIELESQIYDLDFLDDNYIQSCAIVFLIPEEANGREKYYVYYDDSEKTPPNYTDHVDIQESYYRYEPITGYPLTSQYYKILQDGYIPYAISLEGEIMGYHTSQHVTKLKDKTTEVLPKNGDLFAAFNFEYYYGYGTDDSSTTSECLVSKEIIVNGNLMVEFGIVSTSKRKDVKTTAIYKYYYCPSESKRIHTHIIHEALDELYVDKDVNNDGIFATIQSGGISSSTIKDLNVGEILPYLHIYTENDIIEEFPLDIDPEYIPDDPDIRVLSTDDDVDIGDKPWICFDYGESGISHAVIFSSNKILKKGTDERDGIQVKAYEMDYPHLPGIENDMATVTMGRNSYESGGVHDRIIPNDFLVEFDAEFFSSKTGGYNIISKETEIFQSLVEIKPKYKSEFQNDNDEIQKHDLTVFSHFALSTPMGSALSALFGRNFSYINAELYKDNEFVVSGSMGRLLLKPLPDMSNLNKIQQIITILSSFDFRNFTFVKKICFQNIPPGRYVIKIYKENLLFSSQRKYIGFKIIDVIKDIETRIICRPQAKLNIILEDQNNKPVKDAKIYLIFNNETIAQSVTNNNGEAIINAPCQFGKKYDIKVYYNDIIVFEDNIKLSFANSIISKKISLDIQRYDLSVNIFDTWNLIPEIKLTPKLTDEFDIGQTLLIAENQKNGVYLFKDIPLGNYKLIVQYKSFNIDINVNVPCEDITIIFPAEYKINLNTLDLRGNEISELKIVLSRNGKNFEYKSNKSSVSFLLPPGTYNAKIYDNNNLIGARKIDVFSKRSFDIITQNQPLYPMIITILFLILTILGLLFSYKRKDIIISFKIIIISLISIAVISPWWILYGSDSIVKTSTTMYISPINLVTSTTTSDILSGEIAYLPQIFIDVIYLIPILTIITAIFVITTIFLEKKYEKLNLILLFITAFTSTISVIIFSVGMNELSKLGIGGFIGEKLLEINIPGEQIAQKILCHWGPSNGFYMYIIALILIAGIAIFNLKKCLKKYH